VVNGHGKLVGIVGEEPPAVSISWHTPVVPEDRAFPGELGWDATLDPETWPSGTKRASEDPPE
jgi:hypothetical protein